MPLEIREETPEDIKAIRALNRRAFGQEQEGHLVNALRGRGAVLLSLVATLDGKVVGHILYSPILVGDKAKGAALGPMAVLPERQRQGIGAKLVEAGNKRIKDAGHPFIIVLGHPEYYPRFGFKPASSLGITCEWPVPDNAFMVLPLDEAGMQGVSGQATYRPEFRTPPVPGWKPGIPAPLDRIADRLRYYTNGKLDFAVFEHGTCVAFQKGLPDEDAAVQAVDILLAVFHDHVDMKPLPMDDDNMVVHYKLPVYNVVLSDIVAANWEEIDRNHLKALAAHEVLLSSRGPDKFDDLGKKALFGRCYFFMDAQAPKVVRIVRTSA